MTAVNTPCTFASDGTPIIDLLCSVNEVIQRSPDTLPVFSAYGLDTCCRGNMTVRDAAQDAGVDPVVLQQALEATIASNTPDITPHRGTR